MLRLFALVFGAVCSCFQTRTALQLEIMARRHQINVLRRSQRGRVGLSRADRLFWTLLRRLWPGWRSTLVIVKPETVIRWHRKGFRLFWTWKSRQRQPGRPELTKDTRDLIRRMSLANPLWGAPRIHGELLKLGLEVSETTVAKHMVRTRKPPSQTWRAFLNNHASQLASTDFFVVPTVTFRLLFVFVVMSHQRRRVIPYCPKTQMDGSSLGSNVRVRRECSSDQESFLVLLPPGHPTPQGSGRKAAIRNARAWHGKRADAS